MSEYKYLLTAKDKRGVVTVCLNRPAIHNAFNEDLISELTHFFDQANSDQDLRVIVLTGAEKSFCAGADLNWMSSMIDYTMNENVSDSKKLSQMFHTINNCQVPVIGRINGHALGGGVGLVAVCDYAIASDKAKFGFTEVRLGLIPAVISPYCIRKIGESNARAWFLSGELFFAKQAKDLGLVHQVCPLEELDQVLEKVVLSHLQAAPMAARAAKNLINDVLAMPQADLEEYTCQEIARKRVSEEGQEGMRALLNKQKASWIIE